MNLVHVSPKQYQAFDLEKGVILSQDDCMRLGLTCLPDGSMNKPGFVPLHFTGRFTADKQPVHEQDIVEVEIHNEFGSTLKTRGVIQWSDRAGQYAITFISATPGVMESRIIRKLGTMFTHGHLLKGESFPDVPSAQELSPCCNEPMLYLGEGQFRHRRCTKCQRNTDYQPPQQTE